MYLKMYSDLMCILRKEQIGHDSFGLANLAIHGLVKDVVGAHGELTQGSRRDFHTSTNPRRHHEKVPSCQPAPCRPT